MMMTMMMMMMHTIISPEDINSELNSPCWAKFHTRRWRIHQPEPLSKQSENISKLKFKVKYIYGHNHQ
jgi:hypothetical protein